MMRQINVNGVAIVVHVPLGLVFLIVQDPFLGAAIGMRCIKDGVVLEAPASELRNAVQACGSVHTASCVGFYSDLGAKSG